MTMTAHNHNYQGCTIAATPAFDELDGSSPTMDANTPKTTTSRLVSAPYDERAATMMKMDAADAPVSPCPTEETSASTVVTSITGRFSNIEHRYHIDPRVLGTGHHGSVRECVDRSTGLRYAVKSMRKDDPSVKPGNLSREISLLRQIDHDGIIKLVDVHEDAEYLHLVTELCEGGELFDKISERSIKSEPGRPCFSEEEAAKILHQILVAISYMHRRGIVHRDIKPENLLFMTKDEESPIKLVDFGLARRHREDLEPPMSTIVGTPYYIAPEVLRKRYDKSCDLWSVGVIAYILMCGYPPFNGADNNEVHDAVKRGRYRFPSAEWSCTSREVRDFVRGLLQKDPKKRMTVDQALNHPWMVQHINNDTMMRDEDRQDSSCVEVVFNGSPKRDAIICGGSEKRRSRMPLFGLSGNRRRDRVKC